MQRVAIYAEIFADWKLARFFILLFVSSFIVGCAAVPARPPDPVGRHRLGYEACERMYSACLAGNQDVDESRKDDPTAYGWSDNCNKALKRCYERELAHSVTSP